MFTRNQISTPHNIRNITYKEALQRGLISVPCNVHEYPMIIQGCCEAQNAIRVNIRILGCLQSPFHGPHLVSIENSPSFWVQSLTCFKRQFFRFTDRLSFERCLYLVVDENILLRLKNVRCISTLPVIKPEEGTLIWKNPLEADQYFEEHQSSVKMSCEKVKKTMLQNSIQQLLTTYSRGNANIQQIAATLLHDFTQELQDFVNWGSPNDMLIEIDPELLALIEKDVKSNNCF